MHLFKPNKINRKSGFTLIELMVASAIFIIVMVIAIGAVLSIVDANRKAQSLNAVMTNLNFAVESMVRDLNTGTNYCDAVNQCSQGPNVGTFSTPELSFTNSHNEPVVYRFDQKNGKITKEVNNQGPEDMTAPDTKITSMIFYVEGHGVGDTLQPIILLYLQGQVGASPKTKSTFKLQTLITQRRLDS